MNTLQKLLIVDDDPQTIMTLFGIGRGWGMDVVCATSRDDATAIARAVHPDLVLVGNELSNGRGLETARELHGDSITRSIPMVAMSTLPVEEMAEESLSAGCRAYLKKPLALPNVIEILSSVYQPESGNGNQ